MKKIIFYLLPLLSVLALTNCSDGLDDVEYNGYSGVTVSAPQVTATTSFTVTVSSTVGGNANVVTMQGFCYSLNNPTPSVNDSKIATDGSFSATIYGLKSSTTYYVRAYAYGNSRYTYSETVSVTTPMSSVEEQLANYEAPTYADNYTDIAAWENRSQWNLANVHDPSVVLAEDGYYYMYQTDASYGNAHTAGGHFHGRRSKDLVNWEYLGGTMQSLPTWVVPKLNEIRAAMGLPDANPAESEFGFWAPCVRKVDSGLYRMYYSIVVPGYISGSNSWSERAFIGLMENSNPADNDGWEDKGYVITNASDKGLDYNVSPTDWGNCYFKWNAIDPSYIIDNDGRHYLVYGSWHSGIALVELDATTGKPAEVLPNPWGTDADIAPYGQLIATRQMGNRWQGSEGPEIVYNPQTGYYYLFVAYDALAVPYNTRVCRSQSITGPYVGIDGKDLTNNGGEMLPVVTHPYKFGESTGWVGISHCAIFDDGDGNWYYASQGRLPENVPGINASNAVMMGHVRSIRWTSDGWPVVMPERYGAVPKVAITEAELIGDWENIDLSYSYYYQKTSTTMTLTADYRVEGGDLDGATWEYDATNERISFSNGAEVCLQREVDWEANPRTHTIVYAGYTTSKTYWGKKAQ